MDVEDQKIQELIRLQKEMQDDVFDELIVIARAWAVAFPKKPIAQLRLVAGGRSGTGG